MNNYPSMSSNSGDYSLISSRLDHSANMIKNRPKPKFSNLPTNLKDTLPKNWITDVDNYTLIYIVNLPFISRVDKIAPESESNDGLLWLLILRDAKMSKSKLIKFLTSLSKGNHINIPGIELIPIHAFRIEPLCKDGVLTVDGETVDFESIQGHIMPSATYFMVKN